MRTLAVLLLFAAGAAWGEPPKIVGETKLPPYKLVRLKVENLPPKAGLLWKVRAADPRNQPLIDWATGRNVQKPEWVAPPGVYTVELTVGTTGEGGALVLDGDEVTVTIGTPTPPVPPGPTPPTPPGPQPPTPAPDNPAPIPGDGLRVLVVFETADVARLPVAQAAILYSKTARDFLEANCVAGPDGRTKEYRIYDRDVVGDSQLWQAAMKRPRSSVPWLVVSNGRAGYEGPLPATVADFIELVGKYK